MKKKKKDAKAAFCTIFFSEQNVIALHKNPGNYAQRLSWSFARKGYAAFSCA